MPIYEYLCRGCATRFEKLVRRFGEQVSCPCCAGADVEKQLSVFAVAAPAAGAPLPPCGAGACGEGRGCDGGPCGGGSCGYPS